MALKFPIFMDAQSTTPADPRVVEAMLPYFCETFGNPSSRSHAFGRAAECHGGGDPPGSQRYAGPGAQGGVMWRIRAALVTVSLLAVALSTSVTRES